MEQTRYDCRFEIADRRLVDAAVSYHLPPEICNLKSRRNLLSIIVPARNEEANLPRAYKEITAILAKLPYEYEVIVIDNASSDRTGAVAADLCACDSRWRYLRFSRNFNVEISIAAGL